MRNYLQTLIKEKGTELESEITLDGHIGLTWQMLVDFIVEAKEYHGEIRNMLVTIDFKNGDIFDYLTHLARGMVASVGSILDERRYRIRYSHDCYIRDYDNRHKH